MSEIMTPNAEAERASSTNNQVEALVRQLLWEQIDSAAWFSGLAVEAGEAAIAADVEQWWQLKAGLGGSDSRGTDR